VTGTRIEVRTSELPASDAPGTDPTVWRADLDGGRCRTGRGFLVEVGVALRFPAYHGRNWDAFYECFGDLLEVTSGGMGYEFYDRPGLPERTLHLVIHHAEELLVDAENRDLGILVWELRNPRPRYDPPQLWHRYADLRVTFICGPDALQAFTERLHVAEQFEHDGIS
jgi:Barstar (barnase inhibitor)